MSNRFDEIIALRSELERKIKSFGKEAFTESLAPFFAANPEVIGVTWTQYTPYFNDGDVCEFGVHEPALILSTEAAKRFNPEYDWDSFDEEDFSYNCGRRFESWDLRDSDFDTKKNGFSQAWGEIPEEVFLSVFGDHVEVRIMRNGEVFIDDCEHD